MQVAPLRSGRREGCARPGLSLGALRGTRCLKVVLGATAARSGPENSKRRVKRGTKYPEARICHQTQKRTFLGLESEAVRTDRLAAFMGPADSPDRVDRELL
jgi:hypothetical protein